MVINIVLFEFRKFLDQGFRFILLTQVNYYNIIYNNFLWSCVDSEQILEFTHRYHLLLYFS